MRWHTNWPAFAVAVIVFIGGLFLGSHLQTTEPSQWSAAERLRPGATSTALGDGATVYVPVYSNLNLGLDIRQRIVELAATVSVRNVSVSHPIVLEWVRYHDSAGRHIRTVVETPSSLPPLGSVEFVVERSDTAGGPGASFLVDWKGPPGVDEPVIEAVMVGQSGNAGISFTSRGRSVTSASRAGAVTHGGGVE